MKTNNKFCIIGNGGKYNDLITKNIHQLIKDRSIDCSIEINCTELKTFDNSMIKKRMYESHNEHKLKRGKGHNKFKKKNK